MSRAMLLMMPAGWRQILACINVAARLHGIRYRVQAHVDAIRSFQWCFPPDAPAPVWELIGMCASLADHLCECCGSPDGRRVPYPSGAALHTLCPAHDPAIHPERAWDAVRHATTPEALSRASYLRGHYPVLGMSLEWRDIVRADERTLAPRLRALTPYDDGPAAPLVIWIRVAALLRARPRALRTLDASDLVPLFTCGAPAVRELGLRLLRRLGAPAASSIATAGSAW